VEWQVRQTRVIKGRISEAYSEPIAVKRSSVACDCVAGLGGSAAGDLLATTAAAKKASAVRQQGVNFNNEPFAVGRLEFRGVRQPPIEVKRLV
jgi:hypothetical protein